MNKFISLILLSFLTSFIHAQPITISDTAHQFYCGLPYDPSFDYTYGQSIYYESEIQGSGYITALTFYYLGTHLSHSDSVTFFMGATDTNYFYQYLFKTSSLTKVFDSALSYQSVPGAITIQLKSPFFYSGMGNLIIAANELRAGLDNNTNDQYDGFYTRVFGNHGRSNVVQWGAPINPYILDSLPQHSLPSASGAGVTANMTIHGLTQFPCKVPRNIRFLNVKYDSARILWSPPKSGNTPTGFDVYYSTTNQKPTVTTTLNFTNYPDTQLVLSNLTANTWYYLWLRSRAASCTSVWTLVDSFQTFCAPGIIPTPPEPFNFPFPPHCWQLAKGILANPTQFVPWESNIIKYWVGALYRNQSGSDSSAKAIFRTDTVRHWLISPLYDLAGGNKALEFDAALTNNTLNPTQGSFDADDKFIIVVSTDEGLTWRSTNIVRTWQSPDVISYTGTHYIIPLTGYTGLIRLGFYVQSTAGFPNGNAIPTLFIDNVKISEALPVKLLEFTGTKQGTSNLLKWRTATETNNRGFELQRSPAAGGVEFSSISFVPTKANGGNSTAELSYQFADKKPLAAGSYYRLKQVDFDGKFTYSNVVFIKGEDVTQLMIASLFPNPTHQLLNVLLQSPEAQNVDVIITDLAGKKLQQQSLQLQKGDNNKTINVAALANGTYVVKIVCTNGCEGTVSKFVKK